MNTRGRAKWHHDAQVSALALFAALLAGAFRCGHAEPLDQQTGPAQVKIQKANGRYQLLVNTKPFYLKGAGIETFWRELAALTAFGAAVLTLAAVRLRRQWS